MKIRIIQVGKTRDFDLQEFVKRISPFAQLEIVDLKEVAPSKTFSRERCKEQEGEQILRALGEDFIVALDEGGKQMDSREFSNLIGKSKDAGRTLVFVIGGPFGLSAAVKQRADLLLSFSKMTFTHQMIRLFLLEQIYRAFCILHGKEYHHE